MTVFASCLSQCGLSVSQAAAILGQSEVTIRRKIQGRREMTAADAVALTRLYDLVRSGKVDGMPEGVRDASAALRILRGVDSVPVRRPGPKPKG